MIRKAQTRWALKSKRGKFRASFEYPVATYDTKAEARDDSFEGDVPVKVRLTLTIRELR